MGTPLDIKKEARGDYETVRLKPRTFVVRKFKPGEFGSQFAERGIFDGDELLGLAELWPDGKEVEEDENLKQNLSEFMRSPDSAPAGTAQRLLSDLIAKRARELGEEFSVAEASLIRCSDEAQILWERARKDRIEFD